MFVKRIYKTLAFRLFLLIVAIQTIVLVAFTYVSVRVQQSNLMENVIVGALTASDLIARSARGSMLLNHKEDIHNIIAAVGEQPGIEGIRIYNKQGEVVFGTIPTELHTKVDMNAEACVSCHPSPDLTHPLRREEKLSRIFVKPSGERILGLITPIRNEQQCSNADCHAHPSTKTILGVLDVRMTLAQVDRNLEESKMQLLYLSGVSVLLVSLASGVFIWMVVRRPVKRLIGGMEMVSSGRLDQRLDARTGDEIGQLARAFNEMTEDLSLARKENIAWSENLQHKVKEKTDELEKAHKRMLNVEKMASLGNLASSVAHELNNPLEGILTFAKLLIKRLQKSSMSPAEMQPYLDDLRLVAEESQRCGNIVKNLLQFSRQKRLSFQSVHLRTILERCVLLVNHHAKMNNVELRTQCTDDDALECDPGEIQQVLIALMVNAIEAMSPSMDRPEGGTLSVDVKWSERTDDLVIRVTDTGMGMNEDVKAHMFEPFFTTKSEGKGVGLGLAISYGIVERHHGTIDVESSPGRGATFMITLPAKQPVGKVVQIVTSPLEGSRI